jgi:hypothetical protein
MGRGAIFVTYAIRHGRCSHVVTRDEFDRTAALPNLQKRTLILLPVDELAPGVDLAS